MTSLREINEPAFNGRHMPGLWLSGSRPKRVDDLDVRDGLKVLDSLEKKNERR